MSAIIQQTCEDDLVDYSLSSWAEDLSTLFVFILVSLCCNQLDKTANKFGHNGSSQCKIVPRGTLLWFFRLWRCEEEQAQTIFKLQFKLLLLFKTSRRMTTLPQMTTKQIADVLKTIPSVGGNKEEEEKKKIKLHQYPTLAVRSARIVNWLFVFMCTVDHFVYVSIYFV